jgi:hypothetical protein
LSRCFINDLIESMQTHFPSVPAKRRRIISQENQAARITACTLDGGISSLRPISRMPAASTRVHCSTGAGYHMTLTHCCRSRRSPTPDASPPHSTGGKVELSVDHSVAHLRACLSLILTAADGGLTVERPRARLHGRSGRPLFRTR